MHSHSISIKHMWGDNLHLNILVPQRIFCHYPLAFPGPASASDEPDPDPVTKGRGMSNASDPAFAKTTDAAIFEQQRPTFERLSAIFWKDADKLRSVFTEEFRPLTKSRSDIGFTCGCHFTKSSIINSHPAI